MSESVANFAKEYVLRPLGFEGFPYPTSDYTGRLNIFREAPLLSTRRSHEEMMGILLRGMVTPSMLGIFEEAVERRFFFAEQPELSSRNRVQYLIGEPGIGKSHMPLVLAEARDPRGAISFDCGKQDINSLIWQTDFVDGKIVVKQGLLLRAILEGREIVLHEYNKSKQASDAGLQSVWQLIIGEIAECFIQGKGGHDDIVLTHKEHILNNPGFYVNLNGNMNTDGPATHSLSVSANSRIDPIPMPSPTLEDWQHRICQKITGVPVSTLYNMAPELWDREPEAFVSTLRKIRLMGLTKEQAKFIPAHQMAQINNWRNLIQASSQLAEFFMSWGRAVDPNGRDAIIYEIDQEYFKIAGIDMRLIEKVVESAIRIPAETGPAGDISLLKADALLKSAREPQRVVMPGQKNVADHFGMRLSNVIVARVVRKTRNYGDQPKTKLYEHLMAQAKLHGIGNLAAADRTNAQFKSIAELLNVRPEDQLVLTREAKEIHKVLCDYLRMRYLSLRDVKDDAIISPAELQLAWDNLRKELEQIDEAGLNALVIPNNQVMEGERTKTPPFERADTVSGLVYNEDKQQNLLDAGTFMESITLPGGLGRANIKRLWEPNVILTVVTRGEIKSADDLANVGAPLLEIMCHRHRASGLGVNLVVVENMQGKPATLVVIDNDQQEKCLVMGPLGLKPGSLERYSNHKEVILFDTLNRSVNESQLASVLKEIVGERHDLVREVKAAVSAFGGLGESVGEGQKKIKLDTPLEKIILACLEQEERRWSENNSHSTPTFVVRRARGDRAR